MHSFIFFVLPFGAFSSSCVTPETQEADVASLLQTARGTKLMDETTTAGPDTHGRRYSDLDANRISAQVEQVTARVTFDVEDMKVRRENNQEHGTHSTRGYLQHAQYSQHRVCVGADDDSVANLEWDYHEPEFTLAEPICFNRLNIIYLSGSVNCRGAAHGQSHFGCDQDSIGLVLTKDDEVVFPKAVRDGGDEAQSEANKQWNIDNIEGYSFMGHGHADWYKLERYTNDHDSRVLQLRINQDGDGGFFMPKGTYRLWYHEDFTGGTENDNSGVACYHLDFELCQGTHQSSYSETWA